MITCRTFNARKYSLQNYESMLQNYDLEELEEQLTSWIRIRALWKEFLWDIESIPNDIMSAQAAIASHVDYFLFPIRLEDLDDHTNSGGNPFNTSIPYAGIGINWISWPNTPLVKECFWLLKLLNPILFTKYIYYHNETQLVTPGFGSYLTDSEEQTQLAISHSQKEWHRQGYDDLHPKLPFLPWLHNPEQTLNTLQDLPPPHNALAIIYKIVCRTHNNIFLDTSGNDEWSGDDNWAYWDVDDILRLAIDYSKARPAIQQLVEYEHWIQEFEKPNAEKQIIDLLLKQGPYHDY